MKHHSDGVAVTHVSATLVCNQMRCRCTLKLGAPRNALGSGCVQFCCEGGAVTQMHICKTNQLVLICFQLCYGLIVTSCGCRGQNPTGTALSLRPHKAVMNPWLLVVLISGKGDAKFKNRLTRDKTSALLEWLPNFFFYF